MKKLFFIAMCAGIVSMAGNAQSNLITNGNFETGTLEGWGSSGDVRVTNANPFGVADLQGMDNYYALLGFETTDSKSTLRQTFDLTGYDATQVDVSFDWVFDSWDNAENASDTFLSFVREDGKPAQKITFQELETTGSIWYDPEVNFAYGTYTNTFDLSIYDDNDARLVFKLIEGSTPSIWTGTASLAGIDNVSITAAPVPEPATMLLFGTGIAGLAAVRRRQKK